MRGVPRGREAQSPGKQLPDLYGAEVGAMHYGALRTLLALMQDVQALIVFVAWP